MLQHFAEQDVEDDQDQQAHEDEGEVFDVHACTYLIIIYLGCTPATTGKQGTCSQFVRPDFK